MSLWLPTIEGLRLAALIVLLGLLAWGLLCALSALTSAALRKLLGPEEYEEQPARGPVHTMSSVCAWCGRDLGPVRCVASQAGKVTHGLCRACHRRALDELNESSPRPGWTVAGQDLGAGHNRPVGRGETVPKVEP